MEKTVLLSEEKIVDRICFIRGKKVMLDRDLAEMYGVVTGHLNRAVKRNLRRFPEDFMFQLTADELENLKSQFVTSSLSGKDSNSESQFGTPSSTSKNSNLKVRFRTSNPNLKCQSGISSLEDKIEHGGTRKLPYVFTEQGVAMLSSVLNSDTAIDANIQIIRVFTRMRKVLMSQKDLVLKIEMLEKKMMEQGSTVDKHDEEIERIFNALIQLTKAEPEPDPVPMEKVGYKRMNGE